MQGKISVDFVCSSMEIDVSVVKDNARKIEKGLNKYLSIMQAFRLSDISCDYKLQKAYKGFYRVRRDDDFCRVYFDYMDKHKNDIDINLDDVISYLYKETGKYEPSFSSKLLATIDSNKPVWDLHVLSQLSIKAPPYYKKDRLQLSFATYKTLENWFATYLQTQNAKEVIKCFDSLFPVKQLTNVKKIDLVLWCMGPKG